MEVEKPQTESCWSGEKKVASVRGKRVKQAQLDCVVEVKVFSQFCKKRLQHLFW